ncbi:MAG: MAPEG family protein [Bacteriovoracaceae bacterium]
MVTSFYLGLLTFLYFKISLAVIKGRQSQKISLGGGTENEILHLTSAHNNFASYTPLFLFALYLLEIQEISLILIHILGVTFFIGRILHYHSMKEKISNFKLRKLGMMMTLWPLLIVALANIITSVKTLW